MTLVSLLFLAILPPFEPDPNDPDTAEWVDWFTMEDSQHTRVALNNARIYAPRFRKIFKEEGVPENLIWIAWVETHFRPREISRTGAKGIFQFKPETARFLGMTVNRRRDDRNIPDKSARAAAKYLIYLYRKFPDWDLTLAAYNLGEGDLRRAMQKLGGYKWKEVTWKRVKPHLRKQTREYVGKVQAAAILGDLFMNTPQARITGKVYRVRKGDNIYELSKRFGISEDAIRRANNFHDSNIYPGENLILPGLAPDKRHPTGSMLTAENTYTVVSGDTLGRIARNFGISIAELKENNGLSSNHIVPGQKLYISSFSTYTVKRGDTLYSLARRFETDIDTLKALNGLDGNALSIGQKLAIPKQ